MTPSKEREILRKVKDLMAANDELDKRQGEDIAALTKRVEALENTVWPVSEPAATSSRPQKTKKTKK